MKNIIYVLAVLLATSSCNNENTSSQLKIDRLEAEADSLQSILEIAQYNATLLEQMGVYMDSIDISRKWIQVNLEVGVSNEDYVERMKRINQYVKKAEWTISELEKYKSGSIYQLKKLKNEIAERNEDIKLLQMIVANYQEENAELSEMLTITESELMQSEIELDMANQKNEQSSIEIKNLIATVQLTEAESYFAQGESMEELAKRTQLAPNRKKETLYQALEMYQSARKLDHPLAGAKVKLLKQKLKMS